MGHRSLPIRQLPSGRWQARPAGVDPATFDSYDEAEAWCLEQLVARGRGTASPPGTSRLTFRAYADEWDAAQPWSPGTRERVHTNLRRHLYPRIGHLPITRLRPTQLQAVVTSLAERWRPSSVGTVVQHLRQVLNGAVADRIIADSPAARLRFPRPDDEPIVVPTLEQVRTITDSHRPPLPGPRRRRRRARAAPGRGVRPHPHLGRLPTPPGPRPLPDRPTRQRGAAHRGHHQDRAGPHRSAARHRRRRAGPAPRALRQRSPGRVDLHQRAGHDPTPRPLERPLLASCREAAGLDAGFHSLRHFCATTLLRRGVSVAAVARILGHSPATCLAYYSHWIADDAELVRGVLDDVLSNDGNEPADAVSSGTEVARTGLSSGSRPWSQACGGS